MLQLLKASNLSKGCYVQAQKLINSSAFLYSLIFRKDNKIKPLGNKIFINNEREIRSISCILVVNDKRISINFEYM